MGSGDSVELTHPTSRDAENVSLSPVSTYMQSEHSKWRSSGASASSSEHQTFDQLPKELVHLIFSWHDASSVSSLRTVSKRWKMMIESLPLEFEDLKIPASSLPKFSQSFPYTESVHVFEKTLDDFGSLSCLVPLRNLKSLFVPFSSSDPTCGLALIQRLESKTRLVELMLHVPECDPIVPSDTSPLESLGALTSLALCGIELTSRQAQVLRQLSALRLINLRALCADCISEMMYLDRLESLYVEHVSGLSESDLAALAKLTQLRVLCLSGYFSYDHLVRLSTLKNLEQIRLPEANGSDLVVRSLSPFHRLKELDFPFVSPQSFKAQWLDLLAPSLTSVKQIRVHMRHQTGEFFQSVCRYKCLETLLIRYSHDLTPNHLQNLSQLQNLRFLSIAAPISLETSLQISVLTQLEELTLKDLRSISASSYRSFSTLTRLKLLQLENSKLTCSSLQYFANNTRLQVLYLNECTALEDLPNSQWDSLRHCRFRRCPNLGDAALLKLNYISGLYILHADGTRAKGEFLQTAAYRTSLKQIEMNVQTLSIIGAQAIYSCTSVFTLTSIRLDVPLFAALLPSHAHFTRIEVVDISDAHVPLLMRCGKLRRIDLTFPKLQRLESWQQLYEWIICDQSYRKLEAFAVPPKWSEHLGSVHLFPPRKNWMVQFAQPQ